MKSKIDDLLYELSKAVAAEAGTPDAAEDIYNYLDGHVRAWLDGEVI